MEGIIKLVGLVTDVVYLCDATIVFSLECRAIFAKEASAKEYDCLSLGNQPQTVDVPYQGATMMSKFETDKFCFDKDLLGTGGFGAKISEIRRGHQVEVYVHWCRAEGCQHTAIRNVVVVNQALQPQKLNDLIEKITEKHFS